MPGRRVAGVHRVPGDKSVTHRALMLAALAPGRSVVHGALTSLDAQSTAAVLRALGATISPLGAGAVTIDGARAWVEPGVDLDCGNSGTTARLMLGILAAQALTARLTGDSSLRRRPMRRVTEPLRAMGAGIIEESGAGLPVCITGGALREIRWDLPVASAQLKSAILLAAASGGVPVTLTEPAPSRDHTERMLVTHGFTVRTSAGTIRLEPTGAFVPFELTVPGDPSSAAFLVGAAILATGGELTLTGVGVNPGRVAAFDVMRRMGASVEVMAQGFEGGEPVGTITAHPSALVACDVGGAEVPALIDEIPMLACLAARAAGTTTFHDVGELRVKESDRLQMIATNLRAIGASAAVRGDDLVIEGHDRPLAGRVVTGGDHRIAMAFTVLGTQGGNDIRVDDAGCAAVSFPGFHDALAAVFERAA